jgi:hypothetical protein
VWSLRFARHTSEPLNRGKGSPKRFFNYTRDPAFQEFDTDLTYLLHRHHTNVEIFISFDKTEGTTELERSFPVEIARGYELDLTRMCCRESRERGCMARS